MFGGTAQHLTTPTSSPGSKNADECRRMLTDAEGQSTAICMRAEVRAMFVRWGESRCIASATSSLPDPVGPSINTAVERGATSRMRRLTSSMHGALPISSGSRLLTACAFPALADSNLAGSGSGDVNRTKIGGIDTFCWDAGTEASPAREAFEMASGKDASGLELGVSRAGAVFHAAVSVSWLRRSA